MLSPSSTEMLTMLLDSADAFLLDRHSLGRLRIGGDDAKASVDPEIWMQMAELGWLSLGLSEALGGPGLDYGVAVALCERLGRALLPEPYIAGALMPASLLSGCPPGDRRDGLAAALESGRSPLTIAWQERPDQLSPDHVATRLEGGRLTGRKMFVPYAQAGATLLVTAVDGAQDVLVAISDGAEGVALRTFRTGDGSGMAEITFDRASVDTPPLARGDGLLDALAVTLDRGALALAAQLTGLADGALAQTLNYLKTRQQFGRPIGAFQALQHRAVDLYLAVELAKASWRAASDLLDSRPGDTAVRAAVSGAKATAIRAARATTQAGVQVFGAMGFTEEADIGLYLRSALHWGSWLGSETAHRRRFYRSQRQKLAA